MSGVINMDDFEERQLSPKLLAFYADCGMRVAYVRQWRGLSRKRLARYVGVSKTVIRDVELGTPGKFNYYFMEKIAKVLAVPVERIYPTHED